MHTVLKKEFMGNFGPSMVQKIIFTASIALITSVFFISFDGANAACVPVCNPGICSDGCGGNCPGPCNDGNACTSGDVCGGGTCSGASEPDGTACTTDGNPCTTDQCITGLCDHGTWLPPACTSLTASPSEPIRSQGVNYTAVYTCATNANIVGLGAFLFSGDTIGPFPYNPPAGVYQNTYSLDLSNPTVTVPNACSVTVKLKPQCTLKCNESTFGPATNPCSIAMGQDVDLEWTTIDRDATKPLMITTPVPDSWNVAALTPPAIAIDKFVNPPITYTMTVEAVNGETNTCTATTGKLPSCTITANPPTITTLPVQSSQLSWATVSTGPTTATLNGVPVAVNNPNYPVTPGATQVYTLVVTDTYGTGTCKTTVNVVVGIPPTCTLTASPTTITIGMPTTLTWTSNGVSAVIDNGVGLVAPAIGGNVFAYPTSNMSYTMTATGNTGITNTCTSPLITVNPLPVYGGGGPSMHLEEFTKSTNVILHDVAKELLAIVVGLALFVFILSGIYFMISRGVPENRTKAKKMLLYAIIGMMVAGLSYALLILVEGIAV